MTTVGEYAQAGVNYADIDPFKRAMIEVGRKTLAFPKKRNVVVFTGQHGAVYKYIGDEKILWSQTQEGLGNKNWIAELMYKLTGQSYYRNIGIDVALMAVNDLIACGAMPVVWTDEVAAGNSEWFKDTKRTADLAQGFFDVCEMVGMALPAGESPSLKYLIKAEPPVESAPSLSGCATGIICPVSNLVTGADLDVGDVIIGVTSSGLHANGISLVIKRAMGLPDGFLTKLPNGKTLGEEALIPTRSYVALIEELLKKKVPIHALLPGTGGGVSKIAFDKNPFTYVIHSWPKVPVIFQFMRELGVTLMDCLTTFNWGVGYYIFVPREAVDEVLKTGKSLGYELYEIGEVKLGPRQVDFQIKGVTLSPPCD